MATGADGEAGAEDATGLDAVVLAAGAGARFGGGKLLAPWGEGVLLDAALAAAFAAPARTVAVVWGADGRVPAAALAFAERAGAADRLRLVHAERAAEGLAWSLGAGIASLPAGCAGAFVFLGDMPRVAPGLAGRLAGALAGGALAVAPTFEGRRGHPVLFGRALFPQLLALDGDRGAAAVLAGLGEALALVPSPDAGVLFDVDRPGDLGRLGGG
ncbi:MAG: NTP transferase domain-containing protein [Caulobacteraceae bacterium]|nr:NTP transferase domain-containing protein [Caulobacteraceae bacterium]